MWLLYQHEGLKATNLAADLPFDGQTRKVASMQPFHPSRSFVVLGGHQFTAGGSKKAEAMLPQRPAGDFPEDIDHSEDPDDFELGGRMEVGHFSSSWQTRRIWSGIWPDPGTFGTTAYVFSDPWHTTL